MDFFNTISNIRSLRVACRELSLEDLEKFCAKVNEIYEERKSEDNERLRKLAEQNEALNTIRALISQTGLKAEDLNALLSSGQLLPQPNKRNVPAKYSFTDENGNEHTWTGQGRTPTIFVECMKREGKNRDDYLI